MYPNIKCTKLRVKIVGKNLLPIKPLKEHKEERCIQDITVIISPITIKRSRADCAQFKKQSEEG